jgi:hypothetical protein
MSQFTPRSGKANYIKPRGKHFYYHRAIPPEFRQFFDGKTEWNIKLEATTEAGRKAEAGALAHQHNKTMTIDVVEHATITDSDRFYHGIAHAGLDGGTTRRNMSASPG